ncbi:4a-hydroxytetrahydrobiopterin dehydratase [Maribacter sp. ACAM166]|jgi:4a-hydroxytetrahydrobiopterin dehydratase|uniref:4a-hydroxytetrahydrobiopterin dehydratase n=1 Tax=Maribacter sp. ACAM166 TaxID=2508996 RepID=UPI0010FD479B|nr:4a-hydroxytetrahydrobiopterin dehydratase [Maribacter sp. ACAM166]TLP70559.1 4a-hydroxytetrahydrobiopterin dehydratase [Maribacter sp. ACAM166]
MKNLNKQEAQERMKEIDTLWSLKGKSIYREIIFKDFVEAFSFMTSVAIIAEKSDHHPTWKNTYNKVNITLNTHDADGLTNKDFQLAKGIDMILKNYNQ